MIEHNMQSDKHLVHNDQPLQLVIMDPMKGHQARRTHHHNHHHHMQEDIQKYLDMQRLDPDWQFAEKHGNSTKPGRSQLEERREECICCLREIIKEPLNLCQNSKQLQFLGYGFPLYFIFMKYSMAILLLQIINYTSIELYWSINANIDFCINDIPRGETHCTSWMVFLSNISEVVNVDEHIIRFTSFFTLLVTLIYVRDQFTKTWLYYDERDTTYSDFSILVEKIPPKQFLTDHSKTIGQRLRDFFADQTIFPSKLKIAKINLIGDFQVLQKLEHSKKQLAHKLQDYAFKNKELSNKLQSNKHINSSFSISQQHITQKRDVRKKKSMTRKQIGSIELQIKAQKHRLNQLIAQENLDCDKAIICFEHQSQKQEAIENFQSATEQQLNRYFQSTRVKARSGPQPHQINWENMNVSRSVQRNRIILSWIIFLAILGAATVGFYYLLNFKSHEVLTAGDTVAQAIDYSSLVGIIFFNKFILAYIIHHLVEFQSHKTGQSSQFSLMLKYSLGLFFTTAVMTILVQGITHDNVFKQHYGIVEEQTIMFFFTSFLVPLIWLINPWYLWKLLQRKLHKNSPFMTQEEANKLMEDPEYLMGKRYGQVLKSLWFTYLYSCVIPFGSILIFIGTGLYYWIDKYNLLRKSSILQGVSGNLCMKALFLMDFILVLKPAGELIFDGLIRHQWYVLPIVEISIGALYLLLPMTYLLSFFHQEKFMKASESYFELKKKNYLCYQLFNPLTKQEQLKGHFQKIEDCSEASHAHPEQQVIQKEERSKQRRHSIIRPHLSSKKKIQQLSKSSSIMQNQEKIEKKH